MSKIYKITDEEKERKIQNLDKIFQDDIEKRKNKILVFLFSILIFGAIFFAVILFLFVKFGFFVDFGFFWIVILWSVCVLLLSSGGFLYIKNTKFYKDYQKTVTRYKKFCELPEKFIYKKLSEFDLLDYLQENKSLNLSHQKWTLVTPGKIDTNLENTESNINKIDRHNKFAIANEIEVILNKNRAVLENIKKSGCYNFYEAYKIYGIYNEGLKIEAYERVLKEINEALNEIDKLKFKAVFQKEF